MVLLFTPHGAPGGVSPARPIPCNQDSFTKDNEIGRAVVDLSDCVGKFTPRRELVCHLTNATGTGTHGQVRGRWCGLAEVGATEA